MSWIKAEERFLVGRFLDGRVHGHNHHTMSTILKTAAMSLLSKTLQTFLYKYLSDVDVEGVALPSVYDGSGWGVRLSNVKLREGVQLMEQMPGKERKRRKRSKKKRKQKVTPPTVSRVGEQDKELEDMSLQQPSIHTDTHDFPDERPNQFQRGTEVYEEFQEISLHLNDMGHYHASRSRTNSYDDLRVPVDDEELTSPPSRPSTPLQDSKSIFSCFTKGRDKQHNNARTMPEIDAPDEGNDVTSKPPVSVVEESTMYRQVSALASDEKKEAGHMEGSARTGVTVEQDESDDEDDYEDYEQPYKLCLGDNGRIGTLDIRYVHWSAPCCYPLQF